MKKIIPLFLFLFYLSSCDSSLNNLEGAQVVYINSWAPAKCRYECTYKTGMGYETIFFLDSCGKYKVGDTVHIQKLTH